MSYHVFMFLLFKKWFYIVIYAPDKMPINIKTSLLKILSYVLFSSLFVIPNFILFYTPFANLGNQLSYILIFNGPYH